MEVCIMFWSILSGLIAFLIFCNLAFMAFCLLEMKEDD